jgi:uncharacterized membrane protein (UPF0127 family)
VLFKPVSFILVLSLGILFLNPLSCKEEPKAIKQTKVVFKKEGELTIYKSASDSIIAKLDIEIANTDYEIQTGLMYRESMEENQGMLFVFEDARQRFFYMKNTKIPLDIIYIDTNKKIVSFQKNAKPFNEASLPSNVPAKYVLEVNAGLADTWGLASGDTIWYLKNN